MKSLYYAAAVSIILLLIIISQNVTNSNDYNWYIFSVGVVLTFIGSRLPKTNVLHKTIVDSDIINTMRKKEEHSAYLNKGYDDHTEKLWDSELRYVFDNQHEMIKNGVLKVEEKWRFEVREPEWDVAHLNPEFEQWLERNMKGYYNVWQFGNGRNNTDQVMYGIWRVWIDVSRPEDMFILKMRFGKCPVWKPYFRKEDDYTNAYGTII